MSRSAKWVAQSLLGWCVVSGCATFERSPVARRSSNGQVWIAVDRGGRVRINKVLLSSAFYDKILDASGKFCSLAQLLVFWAEPETAFANVWPAIGQAAKRGFFRFAVTDEHGEVLEFYLDSSQGEGQALNTLLLDGKSWFFNGHAVPGRAIPVVYSHEESSGQVGVRMRIVGQTAYGDVVAAMAALSSLGYSPVLVVPPAREDAGDVSGAKGVEGR
jgi:hypothetical protein